MHLKVLYTVIFGVSLGFHPFHVSVMDIEHNAQSNSVQVSHRIFIDDLEQALKEHYNMEYVDTYNPDDLQELDSLIGNYLNTKVFIKLEGEEKTFNYLGSEVEGDARWCYYEISNINEVNEAEITNVTLMEVFNDQQNIVHFKSKGKLKSYKLDKDDKFTSFSFQE